MARAVKITRNETHWMSRDIAKLVRLSIKAGGGDPKKARLVTVSHSDTARIELTLSQDAVTSISVILISLPKRGMRNNQHPLLQLAQAALGSDGDILPLQQTYWLAKALALRTVKDEHGRGSALRRNRIIAVKSDHQHPQTVERPYWIPEDFSIRKYAPAKKRTDTRTFIERVEDDIAKAEARIEKWEIEIEHAESHLDRAQKDLKKHLRRLREAKKRRSAS